MHSIISICNSVASLPYLSRNLSLFSCVSLISRSTLQVQIKETECSCCLISDPKSTRTLCLDTQEEDTRERRNRAHPEEDTRGRHPRSREDTREDNQGHHLSREDTREGNREHRLKEDTRAHNR
jgi:hypothetical protein